MPSVEEVKPSSNVTSWVEVLSSNMASYLSDAEVQMRDTGWLKRCGRCQYEMVSEGSMDDHGE